MPTDLTGTPTSLGIGTYNVDNDAPSGLGFNAAMGQINALIAARVIVPAGISAGDVAVWNGTSWVVPSGTRDGTKGLLDNGSWGYPSSRIHGTHASGTLTTTATTFATGADFLTSPLTFTADGTSDYILRVSALNWAASGSTSNLSVNLDSTDNNLFATLSPTSSTVYLSASALLPAPSAGSHTVNVRVWNAAAGTTSIQYGNHALVSVERA